MVLSCAVPRGFAAGCPAGAGNCGERRGGAGAGTAAGQSRAPRAVPPSGSAKVSAFLWHFVFPGMGRLGKLGLWHLHPLLFLGEVTFPFVLAGFQSRHTTVFFPPSLTPSGMKQAAKDTDFPRFLFLGIKLGSGVGMCPPDFGGSLCPPFPKPFCSLCAWQSLLRGRARQRDTALLFPWDSRTPLRWRLPILSGQVLPLNAGSL